MTTEVRPEASARTLRAFITSYHDLMGAIRDVVLPNPDAKVALSWSRVCRSPEGGTST